MDTKKLRQKILDLAIRGKLVPQDPNDEPASVLLERIRAEKERLIKEGKIKRSKKTATDDEIEAPFEIPESWEWTTIGELLINRDSERVPLSLSTRKKQTNKIYDYYGAAGVIDKVDNYLFSERLLLIGEDGANLLSRSKNNAFFAEGKYWVNNHAHVLDCSEKFILDYVAFIINSMSLEKYVTGSAQPKLTQDNLNKISISLPPREEQKRIINEVERWFTVIDTMESNEGDLLKAIDQAKSKILDLAIHGKLVPQDPNDESASETLREIYEEKAKLVKYGKLKKKNLVETPIYANEFPFMIPENWEWARMNYFVQFINGDRGKNYPSKDKLLYEGDFPFISAVNITDNGVSRDGLLYLSKQQFDALSQGKLNKGDIVLCIRGSLGKTAIYPFDKGAIASSLVILRNICNTYNKYVLCFLKTSLFNSQLNSCDNGTAQPNLSADNVANFLVPFPPLNEQKRIVNKIEELFTILDGIKASLA